MIEAKNIKEFYNLIINENDYDFTEQNYIEVKLSGGLLYYNRVTDSFLYYHEKIPLVMTKEEGLKLINVELRKRKILKLKSKIK
jgi:hypothetical protein